MARHRIFERPWVMLIEYVSAVNKQARFKNLERLNDREHEKVNKYGIEICLDLGLTGKKPEFFRRSRLR